MQNHYMRSSVAYTENIQEIEPAHLQARLFIVNISGCVCNHN
jgi:hypothetical protein